MVSYVHHPFDHDHEACTDARLPQARGFYQLKSFVDANWGSQIGNSVDNGVGIELFKLRSMGGYIIIHQGDHVA